MEQPNTELDVFQEFLMIFNASFQAVQEKLDLYEGKTELDITFTATPSGKISDFECLADARFGDDLLDAFGSDRFFACLKGITKSITRTKKAQVSSEYGADRIGSLKISASKKTPGTYAFTLRVVIHSDRAAVQNTDFSRMNRLLSFLLAHARSVALAHVPQKFELYAVFNVAKPLEKEFDIRVNIMKPAEENEFSQAFSRLIDTEKLNTGLMGAVVDIVGVYQRNPLAHQSGIHMARDFMENSSGKIHVTIHGGNLSSGTLVGDMAFAFSD